MIIIIVSFTYSDTPQFPGGPYFFSENLYQSVSFIYASMYHENVHAIHIAMQFAKKSRHFVIKIDSQQQRTQIGVFLHVARSRIRPTPLIQSCSTGDEKMISLEVQIKISADDQGP